MTPRSMLAAAACALACAGAAQAEDALDLKIRNGWAVAVQQDSAVAQRSNKTSYPKVTTSDAAQAWTYAGAGEWTSGFFPANLWLLHGQFAADGWSTQAQAWQNGMEGQDTNTGTHDVGFMVFTPFGNAYRLTGVDSYRQVALTAANSLSQRYNGTVGAVRSWGSNGDNANFQVIMDNMMNLELLFWASQHGGSTALYNQARSHALKTRDNHVRADGSSWHLVTYDPVTGGVKSRTTVQGYSDSSTWARGQAWGIYGFTMTYRFTGETTFRDTARKMADWYLAHLPADAVPYWDFNDPAIPNAPRDTSAAAIAAAGLIELSLLETDSARATTYRNAARTALGALLSAPWFATLGSPSNSQALLLQSAYNHHAGNTLYNQGTAWGDYYLLEAMQRWRRVNPGLATLPVASVSATSAQAGNPAANAIDGNLATRWSAEGDGQAITLDLGSSRAIQKVGVAFYLGDQRTARFDIATSPDGNGWTTRWRGISSGQTTTKEFYDITDVTARYVRITGHGSTASQWNSVTELSVH